LQPVLIQTFVDELTCPIVTFPILQEFQEMCCNMGNQRMPLELLSRVCIAHELGKLIHLMKWFCIEGLNPVRELSQFMKEANGAHVVQ